MDGCNRVKGLHVGLSIWLINLWKSFKVLHTVFSEFKAVVLMKGSRGTNNLVVLAPIRDGNGCCFVFWRKYLRGGVIAIVIALQIDVDVRQY